MSDEDSNDSGTIVPEQRVSGGRLFIQNGRDFYTKVMSNGVGVIVRGHKTAHIGFDKTPILPHRVSNNRPITLPPHTVSRQFHLIESPGRPLNNAISHLLHSIVKSATPDMVTKTMLTTFTYLTTVLKHSNTIVKTREETISNILTLKYRPTIDYTAAAAPASATVKAESSSLAPEVMASFTGSSNYFTNSLTTTYIYYNTFTVDTLPVILTSRETVTNVVTLPIYMSPTMVNLIATGSRVFETETYFTTYTFSKTILMGDASSEVVTTKEIITQVVVTEALVPPSSTQEPLNTPLPPSRGVMDEITKTYFTTFTHLFTEVDESGQLIIRSSTSVSSEVITETVSQLDSSETMGPLPASMFKIKMTAPAPTFTGWIKKPSTMEPVGYITMRSPSTILPTRSDIAFTTIKPTSTVNMEPETLEPVMIYATKTYYTTYTYFTTLLADGTRSKASVHSRTHVVSKVVTEALSTSFDAFYLNALKSSYLSKHSTMIDITSSVREITPAKPTLDPTLLPGTLVTQGVSYPHWPKDNDELAVEVEGTTVSSVTGVELTGEEKNPVKAEIQVSSASSEEHFDEVKEGVNHIVNVLADSQGSEESPTSALAPSSTQEPIYSTGAIYSPAAAAAGVSKSSDYMNGMGYVERVTLKNPDLLDEEHFLSGFNEKPVTHSPTPPLKVFSSPVRPLTTSKPKTKRPAYNPYTSAPHHLFPDIGSPPKATIAVHSSDNEYSDEDKDDHVYSSMLMGGKYPHSTSVLAKRTGTMVVEPVSPQFSNPSEHLLSLVSKLADGHHWSEYDDDIKDVEEEEIPPMKIYNIHTTFDSFVIPTSHLVPVVVQSPSVDFFPETLQVNKNITFNLFDHGEDDLLGGDMQIHNLSVDDLFIDGSGSGSGSGEGPIVDEITIHDGSGQGPVVETDIDYREEDHTHNPDEPKEPEILESFVPITNAPIPAFPPRTKYTTSLRPNKKKKKQTSRPVFGSNGGIEEESGEASTKVYNLKVPHLDILGQDSVSDESDNVSENKKESEQDDVSSESVEQRPQDDRDQYPAPGPSKSSITFPALGPGIIPAPGSGPVASSTAGIDWKPLLKLGAIGLGGLGASSLTKLGPWFNSMAGNFMKGSLLPLARNDTSHSGSSLKGGGRERERERDRDRPIFHRHPPSKDGNRRPIIQHSDPIYVPMKDRERDRDRDSAPIDDRIPRRPVTSHAKDQNQRPVSLERDRDRVPPGRGYLSPDYDFPPKHNFNFKPPNDRLPNIFSQSNDLHKNGEYTLKDPNLRVINGPPREHSPSDLPEGKTDFILRPISNIINGRPALDQPPKAGPAIPLRPGPPYRGPGSGERDRRPGGDRRPDYSDGANDIPDFDHPPRKSIPEIPLLRPVPPTDGIILPHRVRNEHGHNNRPPLNYKRPFMPPPRGSHHSSKEDWPKPLHPFRNSGEIINLKPPLPPRRPTHHAESSHVMFSEENVGRPPRPSPPSIHMSPPDMPKNTFNIFPHHTNQHHHEDTEASEEDHVFKDVFGMRLPKPTPNPYKESSFSSRRPDISFHPHNAGEGPFRPLNSDENSHHDAPHFDIDRPLIEDDELPEEEHTLSSFSNLPTLRPPPGVAGQPSDKFGINLDQHDQSHEESAENPYEHEFKNEFKKMIPTRKPHWPPLGGNNPLSYSYLDENKNRNPPSSGTYGNVNVYGHGVHENEISSSPSPQRYPSHGDDEATDIHVIPPSPPLSFPPTQHLAPHRQRPSTVYIVQQEEMEPPTTTTTPTPIDFNGAGESSYGVTTQFPKLVIKEIPTRPVAPYYRRTTTIPSSTTPAPPTGFQNPTNRASIAKLFIRKFSTTTPFPTTNYGPNEDEATTNRFVTWRNRNRYVTTPTPSKTANLTKPDPTDTLVDSWLVSPTVNDLQEFLEDFKNNFNKPNNSVPTQGPDLILPHRHSSTTLRTTKRPQVFQTEDEDDLGDSSEYEDDDLEDELSVGAASSEANQTSSFANHPNHHPVHKDPIDADHFFSTGQGDFAQYYSGTEERDTIVDPASDQLIKSPYDDHRRNISYLNRYRPSSSSTNRPAHMRGGANNESDIDTSSPTENDILELPGPTTYRPRFDVTFHNKMGTTSEEPNPTTFRGDVMKPTTFRPGPDDLSGGNRRRPDPTLDMISGSTRRPAPQDGMPSFYDDAESMDQLKIKNKEIMKLPGRQRRPNPLMPDVLEAISDEELGSSSEQHSKVTHSSTTPKSSLSRPIKKGDEYDEVYSEEYDSTYDEDAYLEIPPAHPSKSSPTSTIKNSAEGKKNGQYLPSTPAHPLPPNNSRRPGPLEMLTNFFRRPQSRPPQGGPGGRIPFNPNSSREPTRTMLPPPLLNSKERPELEYQANAFDPNKKTIPLNPNADKGNGGVDDPIILLPKDSDNSTSTRGSSSRERTTTNPGKETPHASDSNAIAVNSNANNNGIRESTYIEQDSEYYEEDEMEEDDKNNVISPDDEGGQHTYTGPPIKFQPTAGPSPKPADNNPRPITIGGHLVNNGNLFRPPTASHRRPPLPQPPPGGRQPPPHGGRPSIFAGLPATLQHVPPLMQNEPVPPKTEMEPPPIDSNRLQAPVLELPSSGPIRYRPVNNNLHRPNLLRPDDELFKSATKSSASKTIHTIASVDELNKIVATNTFTAIIPTRNHGIQPTSTSAGSSSSTAITTLDSNGNEVVLEGSESSVAVPHSSTGASVKMTSILRYTGGRLETTEIEATESPPKYTRGPNIIIPTRVSSSVATSSSTAVTSTVGSRLPGFSRRPPLIGRQSTTSSTSSAETTSPPSTSTSGPSNVRVTVTMESSVSSSNEYEDGSQTTTRRPFIPSRAPTRATFPWMRKTTEGSSTEREHNEGPTATTAAPSTTTTTEKSSPSYPPRMRQPPTNPTLKPESTSKESTNSRFSPSIVNISTRGSTLNRPDILRRTTVVPPRISVPVTKASGENSRVSAEISSKTSSSSESREKPSFTFSRTSTSKPYRRPTMSFGKEPATTSKEKFTTTLIGKVQTTADTPTAPPARNPSVFAGVLNDRYNSTTTTVVTQDTATTNATTASNPTSESFEYEYTDEEYDDEEFELDGESENVSERPNLTRNGTRKDSSTEKSSDSGDTRTVTTTSSVSVSTSMTIGNESKVISVSSEINPTKTGGNNNRFGVSGVISQRPKGILNTMVLRGSMTRVPELPATTKYVTHSETDTKTLTETETTVVVTAGTPYTHTIMITKTVPPQTLISTIVGSVTLVNTADVRPTTVRNTIFAQPTKEVYSFVDTTSEDEDEGDEENNVTDRHDHVHEDKHDDRYGGSTKERVKQGGILTAQNFPRPPPSRPQTPPPNVIVKMEPPTTTTTKEPKVVRNNNNNNNNHNNNNRNYNSKQTTLLEQGCPANCTQHTNQACRPYDNGTKFKCDCKPGFARLKRKFPCRATYTYELSLAINHMDGMSFDFKDLQNSATSAYTNFITVSKDAIDKAFLSTDIKRVFQGAEVMKLRPFNALNEKTNTPEPKVYVDFLVQLTNNITEDRIRTHLVRTLKSSNFSVGRTGISSTRNMSDFGARDFNECIYTEFNDCSINADCINLRGSYDCRCRPGYRDRSPKKRKPGRDCYEMQGCPECNYKGHCRINARGERFCECFKWFGGSKCHINLKILLYAIMGVVGILFLFVLLCSVLVCRRTKIHRERPGSGRFMRYRSPTSQATLDRAAIMNDSASSDGRQSPVRIHAHSFTPDSLLVEGDPKLVAGLRNDSLISPDNVHLMNFSLRNVIMDQVQDRSLTVVIPRAKIRPPSRPPSIHATLGPDANAELATSERKLINYLDHSPYPPPAPYPGVRPQPHPHHSNSRQGTIKRHDSRQFRKLSLQEQRKISSGALVSSGTEVSARGGMRRRSIGPEPEPTYSGYEKSFSDLRSITDTMRSPAQQHLFGTDTSRTSCYSHSCKPPSYCAYSESVGHTMGDKDGASTVYTTQGKLFRMAPDDTDSTASSQ